MCGAGTGAAEKTGRPADCGNTAEPGKPPARRFCVFTAWVKIKSDAKIASPPFAGLPITEVGLFQKPQPHDVGALFK